MPYALQLVPDARATSRVCGPCDACCRTLQRTRDDGQLLTGLGERCPKLRMLPVADGCCSIYAQRPTECRTFQCAWLDGRIEGDERRRPDQLGVMFLVADLEHLGSTMTAWELFLDARRSPQAMYLLERIAKKYLVMVRHFPDFKITTFMGPVRYKDRVYRYVKAQEYAKEQHVPPVATIAEDQPLPDRPGPLPDAAGPAAGAARTVGGDPGPAQPAEHPAR